MRKDGVTFVTNVTVGAPETSLTWLRGQYDAVILALGSTRPRALDVPGADLEGVLPAMTFLEAANRAVNEGRPSSLNANAQHVVILGGGDTGADCLGTVHRHGAASVVQIEILDRPPEERPVGEPWPTMARLFKTTSAHAEGGERRFSTETLEFRGEGRVESMVVIDHLSDEKITVAADLVLIAAGFVGPELETIGLAGESFTTPRATLSVDEQWRVQALEGPCPVFACGDAVRGQSLIVWAIAEGRSAASAVDRFLTGEDSTLPAPVAPYSTSW